MRYQDGTYIFDPEKEEIEPTLTEEQGSAIYDLLEHIDTVVQNGDKLIKSRVLC